MKQSGLDWLEVHGMSLPVRGRGLKPTINLGGGRYFSRSPCGGVD